MPTWGEISAFWAAIMTSWFALMSGVAGIILEVFAFYKRRQRSGRAFFIAGIVCLLLAPFSAWLNEHRAAEEAKRALPVPPIIEGIRFTQKRTSSPNVETPFALQVVIQTDVEIQPAHFALFCDGPVARVDGPHSAGTGLIVDVYSGVAFERSDIVLVGFTAPPFLPQHPITVTLFSKTAIKVIRIERLSQKPPPSTQGK